MKYLPLIWSGICRKPLRATLILLQVAVAFALFGVLQGMKSGLDQAVTNVRADLLVVNRALSSASPLPIAYADRLRLIPGVKVVTFTDALGGFYQKPTQRVTVVALGKSGAWLTIAPEIVTVLPKDLEALQKTRTGALVTADIAKKYGWHIGDRIPIQSSTLQSNGSGTWFFDIVGAITQRSQSEASNIFANYTYLDEARALNKGTVNNFFVVVSDPKQAAVMSDKIDRTFANSSIETDTAPLRERAQQAVRQIGDLNFAIRSIVGAALVALLFSTATMMLQTVRERSPELAVLKTLGFADRAIFLMVLAELVGVCLGGALMGLALARGIFPYAAKFIPGLSMPMVVIGLGLIAAVLIALIGAAVPAARAAKLQVVDALAGR
ncbi:MAG TPA: FtsX-like permease family protein [Steroidobacteraceae bacterium]|nr:FtsX-like permease family protein [Steroidobacteraceae bacterium]